MSERGDQVQKLLSTLSRNGDLVAEAFDGEVHGGEKGRNAGIEALFAVGALKPYDEDSYRLNPRLREFLADHFSSYHAFQALRRVSGTMQQAQEQWRELRRLKVSGSAKDQDRMFGAVDESIAEMAYSIEHNLTMLHALLSTQYGNVDDLNSKLRQNRYYARQVAQFLKDVQDIDAFVERCVDEATASGIPVMRHLVTRRLGARLLGWTSQIKEAQGVISKRLFEAKLLETRLKRLSRYALWLGRHRTAQGWELPLEASAPIELVRPERLQMRLQPDVADTDTSTLTNLLLAASRLPPKEKEKAVAEDPGPQLLMEEAESGLVDDDDPLERCLREVEAATAANGVVSLVGWKRGRQDLADLTDETWLLFAGLQLKGMGLRLRFLGDDDLDAFAVNRNFHDIEVMRGTEEQL